MGERFIETYLRCDIYYLTPPIVDTPMYESSCVSGLYINLTAIRKKIKDESEENGNGNGDGEPTKKPTTLTIDVYPMTGSPPYTVLITAHLTSQGTNLSQKLIKLYKNNSYIASKNTDFGGVAEFNNTVTAESEYYAYFAGDSVYEGCSTQPGGEPPTVNGLGGIALLAILYFILKGGR